MGGLIADMSALDEVYTLATEKGATEVQVLQRKHCASPWRLLAASLVGLAMVAAATTQVHVVPSLSTSSGAAELRSGRRLQGDRQPDEDTSVILDKVIFKHGVLLMKDGKQLSGEFTEKWRTSQCTTAATTLEPGTDLTIDWERHPEETEVTWVDVLAGNDGENLKDLQVLLGTPDGLNGCEYVSVVDGAAGVRFGCGTQPATKVIIRNVGIPARPCEICNVDLS